MTFDERLTWLLIGMVIGGVLGYFAHALRDIRSTVHHLDDQTRPQKDESGLVRKPLLLDFVLLAVVIMVAYASIQSQRASNELERRGQEDLVNRCEAGQDTRIVQRALVEAVYTLATGAAERAPGDPKLSEDERIRYNRYVTRSNEFRTKMYEQIKPPDYCLPYVEDDNVKPPTDPFPTIPPGG
jgi:hypothetical protein